MRTGCNPTWCCSATTTPMPRCPKACGMRGRPTRSTSQMSPIIPRASWCSTRTAAECRHVALDGRRPLLTLEPIFAAGMSPAELQAGVVERAEAVPEGAVARLYLEGVDPDVYRLIDLPAVREAARAALLLKLEPQFLATTTPAQSPHDQRPGRAMGRLSPGSGSDRPRPRAGAAARARLHRLGDRGGGRRGVTAGAAHPDGVPCC